MAPLEPQSSSELFGPNDPEFLEALSSAVLPGDVLESVNNKIGNSLKRSRSPDDRLFGTQALPKLSGEDAECTNSVTRSGDWEPYVRRKRAKLQIQNGEIEKGGGPKSKIFQGLAIYVYGRTDPSVQELRTLVIENGGVFHAHSDQMSLVTHIITCSLTPAKVRDFKDMKVVTPSWLLDSVEAGALFPWQDYVFHLGERLEETQGHVVAQKPMLDTFALQQPAASSSISAFPTMHNPTTHHRLSPTPPSHITDSNILAAATTDVPDYASHNSNPNAERAMQSSEWRAAHTSVAGADFIDKYYRHSRLHHLSTWKAELRGLVAEAHERAEIAFGVGIEEPTKTHGGVIEDINPASSVTDDEGKGLSMRGTEFMLRSPAKSKGKARGQDRSDGIGAERVIMHCDFDAFFVSAGLVDRPELQGKPVVVCHSQGTQASRLSTSEIASASYEARKFGIRNGMSLQQAQKLCPSVVTIPYEFERYKRISLQFYVILMSYADDLQAVSVDEALIEVTSSIASMVRRPATSAFEPDPAKEFAELIRLKVKKATGCEVSIGIANNIMLARLATRRAKPAGSYHLLPADVSAFLMPLHIDDLPGFGSAIREKAQEKFSTTVLGDLKKQTRGVLWDALGRRTGEKLYNALRGIDGRELESDKPRKSVSCEINYGIRFENNGQVETFVHQLAEEVARRLDDIGLRGRSLTLKVMKRDPAAPFEPPKFLGHGKCDIFNKQIILSVPGGGATRDPKIIGDHAYRLLENFAFDPKELRGIGMQVQKLESAKVLPAYNLSGQSTLMFQRAQAAATLDNIVDHTTKSEVCDVSVEPNISVQPPIDAFPVEVPARKSPSGIEIDLPSFSQVDHSVLNVLPEEVRRELEDEYQRRSLSPMPVVQQDPMAAKSRFPSPASSSTSALSRITRQLAPRSRTLLSPGKNKLPNKRAGPSAVSVTEEELQKLNIDPLVFAMLPPDLQREQLAGARFVKSFGSAELVGPRKVIKRAR